MARAMGAAIGVVQGGAPDWVHILDVGRNEARDGRVFDVLDPEAPVADFEARRVDLPVDYHHQHDRATASQTGPIPASGWIKALRVERDRIMARIEWTAQASELIAAKAFRYLSPVFFHRPDRSVSSLRAASLVHDPALHLHRPSGATGSPPPFASSGQGGKHDADTVAICAQLGIKPESLSF